MLVDQHAIVKAVANQAAAGAYYAKPVMATRDDLGSSTTAPYTGVLEKGSRLFFVPQYFFARPGACH